MYGQNSPAEALVSDMAPGRDAAGNVLAEPFAHDADDDMLQEGTVQGGSPCQSILEVLLSERLDTTRAVLQVSYALPPYDLEQQNPGYANSLALHCLGRLGPWIWHGHISVCGTDTACSQ